MTQGPGATAADSTATAEVLLRMLEAPVRVRARGTHDLYELVAADAMGGVLQVTLPLRPPLLGDRIVLELLEPAPPVHLMCEVAGPSKLPYTPDTRFVDVKWLAVLASQRRSFLARALEEILGVRAHLRADDDELGPQRRLVYDVAAQQIRLTTTGERAFDEFLLDLGPDAAAPPGPRQTQPGVLLESDPAQRGGAPFAPLDAGHDAPSAPPDPTPYPRRREPTPRPRTPDPTAPAAGRRPVYADEALFERPVTLREGDASSTPPPAVPPRPRTNPTGYPDDARYERPTGLRGGEAPRTPPPTPPRPRTQPTGRLEAPFTTTAPGASAPPSASWPAASTGSQRVTARSSVVLDGTTGSRRPLFERDPARGYFAWRDTTHTMLCGWVGHSHCVFVVPTIEPLRMGDVIRAALPGDPVSAEPVQVVGVVSRLKPDAVHGRLMVELDLTGHTRQQSPDYRRLVQYWAVRQRS